MPNAPLPPIARSLSGGLLLGAALFALAGACRRPGGLASADSPVQARSEDEGVPSVRAKTNGAFTLSFSKATMIVEPALGGRITRLATDGVELLSAPSVVAGSMERAQRNQFGSTFWVSPQSLWGWPPEAAVDSARYRVEAQSHELRLWGEPGERSGLAVEKRWSPRVDHVRVQYVLHNRGTARRSAAPWEISRVPKGGLVVFPALDAPQPRSTLGSQQLAGASWVQVPPGPSPEAKDAKLFQNGSEGWLAYVRNGWVLLKSFEDLKNEEQAPGEAEIEIYVNGRFGYLEIEQQGRYGDIEASGASAPWWVDWRVASVPSGLDVSPGSEALLEWLRSLVDPRSGECFKPGGGEDMVSNCSNAIEPSGVEPVSDKP